MGAAAELAEGLFMEPGPGLFGRVPDGLSERAAGVSKGHHEETRTSHLARLGMTGQRPLPVIDLGLFAWEKLQPVVLFGIFLFESSDITLDRVVAVNEPEPLHQILIDRHRVPALVHLPNDPVVVGVTSRTGLFRNTNRKDKPKQANCRDWGRHTKTTRKHQLFSPWVTPSRGKIGPHAGFIPRFPLISFFTPLSMNVMKASLRSPRPDSKIDSQFLDSWVCGRSDSSRRARDFVTLRETLELLISTW